ncbi:superoxide dismutase family protein [Pseudonocardia hispaniensis]|uniref:Superoxide dismutase family protein n=1 Tax=Pseudonocardia hispaniensis TaxID=904933 RepID=A0ABW1J0Z3_9PSEU
MRAFSVCVTGVLALASLVSCSGQGTSEPTEDSGKIRHATAAVAFALDSPGAITHLPELVPAGATAKITSSSGGGRSTVTLEVSGLLADRHYGAHAHTKPCGLAATGSGPHFQHQKDPMSPSVDPAYANPQNEIWLDFTTDAQGRASATSTVDWEFTDEAHPASIVVHANHTATEPGKAGTAGDRAACVSVDF